MPPKCLPRLEPGRLGQRGSDDQAVPAQRRHHLGGQLLQAFEVAEARHLTLFQAVLPLLELSIEELQQLLRATPAGPSTQARPGRGEGNAGTESERAWRCQDRDAWGEAWGRAPLTRHVLACGRGETAPVASQANSAVSGEAS